MDELHNCVLAVARPGDVLIASARYACRVSRLWSNPPLDADGRLDFRRLTVAELHEDLTEELSDLVINAGKVALEPMLNRLEADELFARVRANTGTPSEPLISMMGQFRLTLESDTYLKTPEAQRLLVRLAEEFESIAKT